MKVVASTVDEYLAAFPDGDRAPLVELRALVRERLPDTEEVLAHGMPTYRRDGEMVCAFARQKRHLSVYVCAQDAVDAYEAETGAASAGKGCLRLAPGKPLPADALARLLDRLR